jgi:hypothetical protein
MKSKSIWFLIIVVVVIVIVAFMMNSSPAAAPTQGAPAQQQAQQSPAASSPAKSAQASASAAAPAVETYPIHVVDSGKDVYYSSPAAMSAVKVTNPPANSSLSRPATIAGLAAGSWYYGGYAPVIMTDAKGNIIARGAVKAQGNTDSKDLVPFITTLYYPPAQSGTFGVLVFKNANPSGLAANDMSVEVLFKFK